MIIIGQALTTYRRNSMFALTTKQSEVAFDVHEALYFLKRAGLKPGIKHHGRLKLVNIITTEDLIDDTDLKFGSVNVERNVKNAWKEVFGSELSAQMVCGYRIGRRGQKWEHAPGLSADPKNPLNYTIQEGVGQTFSYPFSIAVVEIPGNWVGPIVDFDDAGKLTEKSLRKLHLYTSYCNFQLRYSTEIEHHRRNQTTTRSTRRRKDRNRNLTHSRSNPRQGS